MNQEQQQVIDYLRGENRVMRSQILTRRLRLDDNQRRRSVRKLDRSILGCSLSQLFVPEIPTKLWALNENGIVLMGWRALRVFRVHPKMRARH